MTEISTFSALVDDVYGRSIRRDKLADIISYARSSLRECTVLSHFERSNIEVEEVTTASPHIMQRPSRFRQFTAVEYPIYDGHGNPIHPKLKQPGSYTKTSYDYYYYVSGDSFIFAGLSANVIIKIEYASYFKPLPYYAVADRPAVYSMETESWSYHADYIGNQTLQQQARELVTNWLVFDWYDLILEGTIAKLYKSVGDERASSSYALYKQYQKDLLRGEAQVAVNG